MRLSRVLTSSICADDEILHQDRKKVEQENGSSRLHSILNMPAVRMAIESESIPAMFDDDVLLSGQCIKSTTCLGSENSQMSSSVGNLTTKSALCFPESVCRKLNLPAMEDRTEIADEERISTVGSWVGSLSCWIDAVSDGRGLSGEEAAVVQKLQRLLEDGCLVAAVVFLLGHGQIGVQEYAADVLGRLYIAPLMEAQSEPATRAVRLKGLMTLLQEHGALRACVDLLNSMGRNEDLARCGAGCEAGEEVQTSTVDGGRGLAKKAAGETVLPCTVLSVLNCVQSIVTFHPEALTDTTLCCSLLAALSRAARCASAAAYCRTLSTPRAAAALPRLCGGRTAAEAAAAEDEAHVWAWEVRESAAMTLAQVCAGYIRGIHHAMTLAHVRAGYVLVCHHGTTLGQVRVHASWRARYAATRAATGDKCGDLPG